MKNVKRIFFLTKEEAKLKRNLTNDNYIYHGVPHYELEDGTIIYGKIGFPAGGETWWSEAGEDKE